MPAHRNPLQTSNVPMSCLVPGRGGAGRGGAAGLLTGQHLLRVLVAETVVGAARVAVLVNLLLYHLTLFPTQTRHVRQTFVDFLRTNTALCYNDPQSTHGDFRRTEAKAETSVKKKQVVMCQI